MGGSGGGRGLTPEELRRLEQKAKQSLAGGAKCNAFISFVAEDLAEVNLLRGQAKNENSDIEFNDYSLKEAFDSERAEYIKRGIRERIRQCSVTIVYVSEKTAGSKWVNWEIRESIALGKGVVAMYKGEKPPARVPAAISENKVPLVPWSQRALSEAVKKASKDR